MKYTQPNPNPSGSANEDPRVPQDPCAKAGLQGPVGLGPVSPLDV
jgi:hypothetical protein